MRRGFTLLELMVACGIGAFVLTVLTGLLIGVWGNAKGAADEVQGALEARAARERLYYSDLEGAPESGGLVRATSIRTCAAELLAYFPKKKEDGTYGAPVSVSLLPGEGAGTVLDPSPLNVYRPEESALQCVYLRIRTGSRTAYCERMVVPVFGRHPTADEIVDCFGRDRE